MGAQEHDAFRVAEPAEVGVASPQSAYRLRIRACPNIHECFHRGAATFMILGNLCTRGCGFCSVPKGNPRVHDMRLDPAEPANVARMAAEMRLRYVVITSVNRDDLADGGSAHFAETVREVKRALPAARVEVLTPDFEGDMDAVARVLDARPGCLQPQHGNRASSLPAGAAAGELSAVARRAAFRTELSGDVMTKSGFMVGLGETVEEVEQLLRDLREQDVDVATIGQYLQPTRRNLPVAEYVEPAQFDKYREFGLSLGFRTVFSGPLVRSSYMAELVSEQAARA